MFNQFGLGCLLLSSRQAWIEIGNGVIGERCDPSFCIFEKTKHAVIRMRAHVEPVPGSGRNRDPVIGLAVHLQHLITDVE